VKVLRVSPVCFYSLPVIVFSSRESIPPEVYPISELATLMWGTTTSMIGESIPYHLQDLLLALNPDGSLTIRDTPPQASCRALPSPLSELEVKFYYTGLYSAPILVAHSNSTPWEVPTGPDTYQKLQELLVALNKPFDLDWRDDVASKRKALLWSMKLKALGTAGSHPLRKTWDDDLGSKVKALPDSMEVKYTSIERLRIGREERFVPVVLWIGVSPGYLSGEYGAVVTSDCHKLLVEHDLTDVEVEIRESVATWL